MSTPFPKRRKFDDSASALFRPFKSPLHTSKPRDPSARYGHLNHAAPHSAISVNTSTSAEVTGPDYYHSSSPLDHVTTLEDLSSLQRTHTFLLNQLATVRAELDTTIQALKFESSSRDDELRQLITLWREASRSAAEELYPIFRDYVNGMGGVVEWSEAEKRKRNGGWGGWQDEAERVGNRGSEGDDAENVNERTSEYGERQGEQDGDGDDDAQEVRLTSMRNSKHLMAHLS